MKLSETTITKAGVYRCCLLSWSEQEDREVNVGDEITCKHCGEKFRLPSEMVPVWRPLRQLNAPAKSP